MGNHLLHANSPWWRSQQRFNETLSVATPPIGVFGRLLRDGSSGVLEITCDDASYLIAIKRGLPVGATSPDAARNLGIFLQETGALSPADASGIASIMRDEGVTLGVALLRSRFDAAQLLQAESDHAQALLFAALRTAQGTATFYEEDHAGKLSDTLRIDFYGLADEAFAPLAHMSLEALRELTAPVVQNGSPITLAVDAKALGKAKKTDAAIIERLARGETGSQTIAGMVARGGDAQLQAFRRLYQLAATGLVCDAHGDAFRLPPLPAIGTGTRAALPPLPGEDSVTQLQEYKIQQQLLASGKRLLNSYKANAAADKLQQLVDRQAEPSTEAIAYLAIAQALSGQVSKGHDNALKALGYSKNDAMAHAAISRTFTLRGEGKKAAFHQRMARQLAQNNTTYLAEVEAALRVTAARRTRGKGQRRHSALSGNKETLPWIVAGTTLVILFVLSNILGLGAQEYFYSAQDMFFYLRRLLLLAAGLGGLVLLTQQSPWECVKGLGWKAHLAPMALAVGWGAVVGLASPGQRVHSTFFLVTALTLLHVVAEETFFRGFLTTLLTKTLAESKLVIIASACLFGVYHLTLWSFWTDMGFWPKLNWIGLIVLFAGIPYAWLYVKYKRILLPLLCHGVVNLVMMWLSVAQHGIVT